MLHSNWDLYDTRHVVYRPAGMTPEELEAGYWAAYKRFYRWSSIIESASTKSSLKRQIRHLAYAGGWKKFEPLWDLVIRTGRVRRMLPVLESVLTGFGSYKSIRKGAAPDLNRPFDLAEFEPRVHQS